VIFVFFVLLFCLMFCGLCCCGFCVLLSELVSWVEIFFLVGFFFFLVGGVWLFCVVVVGLCIFVGFGRFLW